MDALLAQLQYSPAAFVFVCTLFGLMVGSFLNVVIYRLPKMLHNDWEKQCAELHGQEFAAPAFNLFYPPSRCDSCGSAVRPLQNIPVLSWLYLHGKCSDCGNKIPARYAVVEAATAILSGITAWHFGFGLHALWAIFFVWAMIALAAIDFDTQLLPDLITIPLLWAGLLVNLGNGFADLNSAVLGAVFGYLSLWSVYWAFKLLTKKEGMGYGDFKLLAAIGAWFGITLLPLVILLSSVVGAFVGIFLIVLARRGRHIPIPFGPYLAGGGMIALFYGHDIMRAYLGTL